MVPSEEERNLPVAVRGRRDALELEVYALRERRGELGDEVYYRELEALLMRLADLYRGLE
jgi:hypothetical protein